MKSRLLHQPSRPYRLGEVVRVSRTNQKVTWLWDLPSPRLWPYKVVLHLATLFEQSSDDGELVTKKNPKQQSHLLVCQLKQSDPVLHQSKWISAMMIDILARGLLDCEVLREINWVHSIARWRENIVMHRNSQLIKTHVAQKLEQQLNVCIDKDFDIFCWVVYGIVRTVQPSICALIHSLPNYLPVAWGLAQSLSYKPQQSFWDSSLFKGPVLIW
jgi:hypothetical protein